MKIDIPYEIGSEVVVKGEKFKIKGIDLYINKKGELSLIRVKNTKGKYVTLKRSRKLNRKPNSNTYH